jgi:hypothetical protein
VSRCWPIASVAKFSFQRNYDDKIKRIQSIIDSLFVSQLIFGTLSPASIRCPHLAITHFPPQLARTFFLTFGYDMTPDQMTGPILPRAWTVGVSNVSGQTVRLPRGVARTEWEGERRALLGLRPTDLGVVAPDAAELRGRVFLVEPVGAFAYVDVDLAGWSVKATVDPDHAPAIGDMVGVSITSNRVCLFDRETEARL